MRSKYKGLYIPSNILKQIFPINNWQFVKNIKTNIRSWTMYSFYQNKFVSIYTGKLYIYYKINTFNIGHKVGSFVFTKKRCVYKKK